MPEINLDYINGLAKDAPLELIKKSEEKYHGCVSDIAERISSDKNIKIVLLSGPSGSGKTTTANLLCDRIKLHGEACMVVSLDDFYRSFDDPEYPKATDGSLDCESPFALDLILLGKTLKNISDGKSFVLPKYDFKTSKRKEERIHPAMPDGCVIIEGLHAINPLVFSSIPHERALKIFISVSTNVNDGGERILSGRKIRFIRRMVRDSLYRNADAERTLKMWKNVLTGEDKYLYPNRENADISFDTFHAFELSVMRIFVEKLISEELADIEPYAKTVLSAAKKVFAIEPSLVPDDSLIREFIPGGKYEFLY